MGRAEVGFGGQVAGRALHELISPCPCLPSHRLPLQGVSHEPLLSPEAVLEGQADQAGQGEDRRRGVAPEVAGGFARSRAPVRLRELGTRGCQGLDVVHQRQRGPVAESRSPACKRVVCVGANAVKEGK